MFGEHADGWIFKEKNWIHLVNGCASMKYSIFSSIMIFLLSFRFSLIVNSVYKLVKMVVFLSGINFFYWLAPSTVFLIGYFGFILIWSCKWRNTFCIYFMQITSFIVCQFTLRNVSTKSSCVLVYISLSRPYCTNNSVGVYVLHRHIQAKHPHTPNEIK